MVIRAESPFDIPSSIKIRSLGRCFIIKVSLGKYRKPFLDIDHVEENGHFADEWPSDDEVDGIEKVVLESHSHSTPLNMVAQQGAEMDLEQEGHRKVDQNSSNTHSPRDNTIPRNVVDVLHDFEGNNNVKDGCASIDTEETNGEFRWAPQLKDPSQAQMGALKDIRRFEATDNRRSLISTNLDSGLNNLVVANSSEPSDISNKSPSFQFVPDSFEGLENSSSLKGGPCEFGISLKSIRLSIRGSLEDVKSPEEDTTWESMKKVKAIFEVSKVLGISFKG
ncbi:hypothetical protein GQ457_02G027640 [Hibiscus cannabinus]